MDPRCLEQVRAHFDAVAETVGGKLSQGNPHVVALVAKWEKSDLVPGLSDMDFRVICDDEATVDDWVQIDRLAGQIHLEMVRAHPEWNRINEHTPGAGMTVSEVLDRRFHNPEYMVWSLWWGRSDWLRQLKDDMATRPFGFTDEHVHLSKFLTYYSPYIHGIDPPINLGPFKPKYALHSRCWHYFAPPMLSAASLLARKNFVSKRPALGWLREHGYVVPQVDAVLAQVDAHYETPELTDPARLQVFEDFLFAGFEQLLPLLLESVRHLPIDRTAGSEEVKTQLKSIPTDPLKTLVENVRFARIRAGRYYFYVNSPDHFDAGQLILFDLPWLKRLSEPIFAALRTLIGDSGLSPEGCFERLGLRLGETARDAVDHIVDLANRSPDDPAVPHLVAQAVNLFPPYYRLLEESLHRILLQTEVSVSMEFPENAV